ncbi:ankyrin repeat domain-containing protein [Parablastomonas sp. CN1-191]|uniref:ankyrin repeat domain-containing protein n=1 Tax=Parablastomonas sp. CN1-191 TaxID=3400908 RepID=UPI003BF85092
MFSARVFASAALALSVLAAPLPAAAQFSPSHKFLQALRSGDDTAALQALSDKVDVNTADSVSGETGLHIAIGKRRLDWVGQLVRSGANINARDAKGQTPLQVAVNTNFTAAATLLAQRGALLNERDNIGETPLITAIHNRNAELVKVLVAAGANLDQADNSGRTARDYAADEDRRGGNFVALLKAPVSTAAKPGAKYGPSL